MRHDLKDGFQCRLFAIVIVDSAAPGQPRRQYTIFARGCRVGFFYRALGGAWRGYSYTRAMGCGPFPTALRAARFASGKVGVLS